MKTGCELITIERQRQINQEGWTPEHDDEHTEGSLIRAAVCYATPVKLYEKIKFATGNGFYDPWPDSWDKKWDKRPEDEDGNTIPNPDVYSDKKRLDLLVKAGALIAAEIDRLNRSL